MTPKTDAEIRALDVPALEAAIQAIMTERAALRAEQQRLHAELDHKLAEAAASRAAGRPVQIVRPAPLASGEAVGTPGG